MKNKTGTQRIKSIDILRAITVALMVFVNDLPGIRDIPQWLGHASAGHDGMFLADIVFPLFLFWVGMSVPLAVDGRQKKGDSDLTIVRHILKRTFSLVFIGVLMVNTSRMSVEVSGIDRNLWALCMYAGVILSWRVYGKEKTKAGKVLGLIFHYIGIGLLIFVLFVFRDKNNAWLLPQWWGILGIIGWAYLVAAMAYVFLEKHLVKLLCVFAGLLLYHIAYTQSAYLQNNADWMALESYGAHASLSFAGMLASLVMKKIRFQVHRLFAVWGIAGIIFFIAGFVSRPLWGISKLAATPSFVYVSLAVGFGLLVLVWYLSEIRNKHAWANVFYPAGTQTFLAYVLPSVYYHTIFFAGISLPDWMTHSWIGILKAIIFTLLIIQLTGILARFGVKLKL